MKIIYSELFKKYPELAFGISTKEETEGISPSPYFLNMGLSVGDEEKNVRLNRELFFNALSIDSSRVAFQKQIHSCNINYISEPKFTPDSDALYSDKENIFLAVQIADCAPVFLYDPLKKVFAGIHSGWKGAECNITGKTIKELSEKFNSDTKDIIAFIGPCISGANYEVGKEFKEVFDEKYFETREGKIFFDLKKVIYDQLLNAGLKNENIEVCSLCTYGDEDLFHSHRREKGKTGRMMGVIGIKNRS